MNLGDHPDFHCIVELLHEKVNTINPLSSDVARGFESLEAYLKHFYLGYCEPPQSNTSEFITATWNGCGLVAAEDSLGAKQVLARLDKLEADLKEHVHKHIYNYGDTKLAD